MKLEIDNKRETGKFMNPWKLNNTLLNTNRLKKTLKGKQLLKVKNGNTIFQNLCDAAKGVHSNNCLH